MIPSKDYNAEKGKMEDTSSPEWQKYYADLDKWRATRDQYQSEMDWWAFRPNKPGYVTANND